MEIVFQLRIQFVESRARSLRENWRFDLFFIFLAAGVGFSYLISREFLDAARQRKWAPVDCMIEQSKIIDNHNSSDPKYTLNVVFSYAARGAKHRGTTVRDGYSGSSDYHQAQKLADAYPVGAHAICFVDPANPEHAVLRQKNIAIGFAILLPLIFVLVGAGGIYFIWNRRSSVTNADPPLGGSMGTKGVVVVCSVFILAGALLFAFWFIPVIVQIQQAKTWPKVPCTIIHAGVSSHSGDEGTTYAVEVLYRYHFNDRDYTSSRYEFMTGTSSGYESKQAIVNGLSVNNKTVCYVNPADPNFAVLNRGYSLTLLFGLIPVTFILFGTIGLVALIRKNAAIDAAITAATNDRPQ